MTIAPDRQPFFLLQLNATPFLIIKNSVEDIFKVPMDLNLSVTLAKEGTEFLEVKTTQNPLLHLKIKAERFLLSQQAETPESQSPETSFIINNMTDVTVKTDDNQRLTLNTDTGIFLQFLQHTGANLTIQKDSPPFLNAQSNTKSEINLNNNDELVAKAPLEQAPYLDLKKDIDGSFLKTTKDIKSTSYLYSEQFLALQEDMPIETSSRQPEAVTTTEEISIQQQVDTILQNSPMVQEVMQLAVQETIQALAREGIIPNPHNTRPSSLHEHISTLPTNSNEQVPEEQDNQLAIILPVLQHGETFSPRIEREKEISPQKECVATTDSHTIEYRETFSPQKRIVSTQQSSSKSSEEEYQRTHNEDETSYPLQSLPTMTEQGETSFLQRRIVSIQHSSSESSKEDQRTRSINQLYPCNTAQQAETESNSEELTLHGKTKGKQIILETSDSEQTIDKSHNNTPERTLADKLAEVIPLSHTEQILLENRIILHKFELNKTQNVKYNYILPKNFNNMQDWYDMINCGKDTFNKAILYNMLTGEAKQPNHIRNLSVKNTMRAYVIYCLQEINIEKGDKLYTSGATQDEEILKNIPY